MSAAISLLPSKLASKEVTLPFTDKMVVELLRYCVNNFLEKPKKNTKSSDRIGGVASRIRVGNLQNISQTVLLY
jgi:hypothetical protein